MKYEKGQLYEMNVAGIATEGDKKYFLIEDDSSQYNVSLYKYQLEREQPVVVYCRVSHIAADGTPVFEQDKYKLLSDLYVLRQKYPFTVGKRCSSPWKNKDSYVVYDNYGFQFRIPVWKRELLKEGETIICKVTAIISMGALQLEPDNGFVCQDNNFISHEQLLKEIGTDEVYEASFPALQKDRMRNSKINRMFIQYENSQGLWIISYLSALQIKRKMAENNGSYQLVIKLNEFYIRLAEWVVEDSPYLTVYPSETIASIRLRIEQELSLVRIQFQAIDLIKENKAEEYISSLVRKIKVSGYLSDSDSRIKLIVSLLFFKPEIFQKNLVDFLFLVRYLVSDPVEGNKKIICKFIDTFVSKESKELDALLHLGRRRELKPERLEVIVRIIAVSLLLDKHNYEDNPIKRSIFYRYLSCLDHTGNEEAFVIKSLNALTCVGGYMPEFNWEDILNFRTHIFTAKVRSFINVSEQFNTGRKALNIPSGALILEQKEFTFVPGYTQGTVATMKIAGIISLYKERVKVAIPKRDKKEWNETPDLIALRFMWDNLQELFGNYKPVSKVVVKALPSVGASVMVRAQGVRQPYPLMVFADIVDDYYEGTGVLYVTDLCRYRIESLEGIFLKEDTFRVTVKSVREGKIGFSIIEELGKLVASRVAAGDYVLAKLIRINKERCTWVSEDGYLFYSSLPEHTTLLIGMSAGLEITTVDPDGYVDALYVEASDIEITEEEALKELIGEYIDSFQEEELTTEELLDEEPDELVEEESDEVYETEAIPSAMALNPGVVRELIHILSLSASCERDAMKRYRFLGMTRLLSFISGDETGVGYYALNMNYQEVLFRFVTNTNPNLSLNYTITEETLKQFPDMEDPRLIIQLLDCWNKEDWRNTLIQYADYSDNILISKLARLVMSNNLLLHTANKNILLSLKQEVASLLNMTGIIPEGNSLIEKEEAGLVNLGLEDGTREFKTSLVYPAGQTIEPDMSRQGNVILKTIAGFLNASGGVLYIGVRDTGDVIGLKEDFAYMECTADSYERFIRSRIVNSFGKDVNSLITFKFESFGNRQICEIHIPKYEKFVTLDNTIWQRQGNETRVLNGVALSIQEERRKDEKQKKEKPVPATDPDILETLLQNSTDTALGLAFKASVTKSEKPVKEKKPVVQKPLIATSVIRPNPINKKDEGYGIDTVAYLSFMENGEYLITDELPRLPKIMLTLAIGEEEQNGCLLFCYENGFANRISIKTLLSKKRKYSYKNGIFRDSRLMFASIVTGNFLLMTRSVKNETEYIKITSASLLKTNQDLTLKGSPVFSFDFGMLLQWDVIPENLTGQFSRICNDSLSYQGLPVNTEGFARELQLLSDYYPRIKQ